MKIEELLKLGKKELIENSVQDGNLIARILLQFILKIDRSEIIRYQEDDVEEENEIEYKNAIKQIIKGRPLQYITKNQEFMGLNFYVDENVLIPQPDTEILVEEVIEIAKKENKLKILDVCTGSGCIGISLAHYIKEISITMSDISRNAIEIAKKNAKANNVIDRSTFIVSDLFENIKEKFDIIVSNPPYIETDIISTLSKQVQNEPLMALDGGKDGLIFYRKLINKAPNLLNDNGYLCMEIGYNQKEKVIELAKERKCFKNIKSIKDLSGNDRVIICKK